MGWNAGYTVVEAQVIEVYNTGFLNKEILKAILKPFNNTDIDSGGSKNLKAKDGKTFENIVMELLATEEVKNELENLKQKAKNCNAELALNNEYEKVKNNFESKEAYDDAFDIGCDLQDLIYESFHKTVGW